MTERLTDLSLLAEFAKPVKALSMHIVSMTGYLLGVKQEIFGREYRMATYEELEKNPDAKILRTLCIIRNTLLKNFGRIKTELRNNIQGIDKLTDFFDPKLFSYLHSQGIQFVRSNAQAMRYLINANTLINERVNAVRRLYPMWVEWDYIRKLFQMPKGGNEKEVTRAIDLFHDVYNCYPYHCYVNWPMDDIRAFYEEPDHELNPQPGGNIMLNDRKFLILLYRVNGTEFTEWRYVTDISDNVRDDLSAFLESCQRIVLAVDCENSDPYKLCAVLQGLREAALRSNDGDCIRKIQKILLYDDVHTIDAWAILKDYVNVPIEHYLTERVNEHKSLVDLQLTAGVVTEHWKNNVDGFLLASSDSDFWGLIKSLPSARFMVLLEKDKYGEYLTDALKLNDIGYCIMDDFAGNVEDIKTGAMNKSIETYLAERVQLNVDEMLHDLYSELRIDMTEKQKRQFRERLLKNFRVKVDSSGELSIRVS